MRLTSFRLFLVDLDDTLYLERDYVLSGLRSVAPLIAGDELDDIAVAEWLTSRFLTAGRDHLFDLCLAAFGQDPTPARIRELVATYRNHQPVLHFLPGAETLLVRMSQIGKVVIVTDGLPSMQAKKCRALGLERWVDNVVYCWDLNAPKPDPASVLPVLKQYGGPVVVIGDNPGHDMCLAQQLGADAIRIRQGRFANFSSDPWFTQLEVNGIEQLLNYF